MAVSDIALKRPLPPELAGDLLAYVGCIAGAILIPDYERGLREAGFQAVRVVDTGKDLNAYAQVESQSGCCGPAMTSTTGLPITSCGDGAADLHGRLADLLQRYDVNEYAASVQVFAVRSSLQ